MNDTQRGVAFARVGIAAVIVFGILTVAPTPQPIRTICLVLFVAGLVALVYGNRLRNKKYDVD